MTTETINRVNSTDYYSALDEMSREFEARFGRTMAQRIAFCECNRFKEPKRIGVNWAAIGTADSDETMRFSEALAYAATKAASFKYNGYFVIFDD